MSGWQANDLAERIADPVHGERPPSEAYPGLESIIMPAIGTVSVVGKVELHFREEWGVELVYLGLRGAPSDAVFDARLFRKVEPQEIAAMVAEADKVLASASVPEPCA